MTQLIIDGVVLPESIKGGYTATLQPLSVDVEMVTGRVVRELRGNVWVITYQYGFFSDSMKNSVLAAVERGKRQAIRCGFLQPTSSEALTYSDFLVTDFAYPKFMWSADGKPLWADFSIELREVRPSD